MKHTNTMNYSKAIAGLNQIAASELGGNVAHKPIAYRKPSQFAQMRKIQRRMGCSLNEALKIYHETNQHNDQKL